MRYDAERQMWIAGPCELPVKVFRSDQYTYPSDTFTEYGITDLTQCTRQVIVEFENRWALSIIWGSMTYSDNHDHPWGTRFCEPGGHTRVFPEFVEEPVTVEVGIFSPVRHTIPAQKIDLPGWKGPDEIPERITDLWGHDVLSYVDAQTLCTAIIPRVSSFDSDGLPWPAEGPWIEMIDDEPVLTWLPPVDETVDDGREGT